MADVLRILFWLGIGGIGYAYFVYPLILRVLWQMVGRDTQVFKDITPAVSIVIAAYNEEKVIRERIGNLLQLDYPSDKLEIVIASDGSSDKTVPIAREYESKGIVLRANVERRGKVNVLNEAVPQAKHSIVVFSDANTFFKPDTVKKIVRRFQDEKVGCVCGRLVFTTAEGSTSGDLEGVYWKFETFLKTVEGRFGALPGANGALFAVRRELFFKCPSDTIIEDFVVPMKIQEQGFKCVYEPEAVALEDAAMHIVQEKKRRIRIGAGDFQSIGLLVKMLDLRRGFPSLAFWSHKVLRWHVPFFLLIAFAANAFLLSDPFFKVIFAAQCSFYALAIVGQMLSWVGLEIKILNLFYYFVSMNLALFLGFLNLMARTHSVKWERTER